MVGERTVNYAASKLQPSALAPAAPDTKVTQLNPVEEAPKAEEKKEEATAKPAAKKPAAKKKTASKTTAKRGRGRPAGSKNKTTKRKTTARKTTAKKASAKTQTNSKTSAASEPFANGNEAMKAMMESGNTTAEMARRMAEEMVKFTNKNFSKNVELSKEFFSCRTISDMFEIQNKIMKQNVDSFFKQSSKMSEMMFKAASKTSAPMNTSLTSAADDLSQAADEWKKKFSA